MTELSIATARDSAQQIVTACLYHDRGTAWQIAREYPDPLVLALVLGDLVAHVHTWWAAATGVPASESWQHLMADVAEWVEGQAR